jgi:hypothetical protein
VDKRNAGRLAACPLFSGRTAAGAGVTHQRLFFDVLAVTTSAEKSAVNRHAFGSVSSTPDSFESVEKGMVIAK